MADTAQVGTGPATAGGLGACRLVNATRLYGSGDTTVRALDGLDVTLPSARFTAIMGPSGSGKSTLLHCVAGLDRLDSGLPARCGSALSTPTPPSPDRSW